MSGDPVRDLAHDPARARFFMIQALRLSGLGLVIVAMAILAGKIDLPKIVAYVLFVVGVLDALILPGVLARLWKTPLP